VEDAGLLAPLAAASQVRIDTVLQDAQVGGDRVLLERLATNLLDTPVRYSIPGGWVQEATERGADGVRLTGGNSGQSVPADQVPELFEPFRRLSPRPGSGTGNGFGLSIAASVAAAHAGRLCARARPDGGLQIELTISEAGRPALAPARCRQVRTEAARHRPTRQITTSQAPARGARS
jgi:signal transduction histidine kinase